MADEPHVSSELSRDLTLFHITMMGLGMMIGAGVFIGIGNCIGKAGPMGLILTFALNGLLAVFTAMSFAELSSAIPRAGGAYNFARIGFGRGPSFLAGWMEWFASSVAGSLYAVVFATYTVEFFSQTGALEIIPIPSDLLIKGLAFLVALVFIYINYRGSSETGKVGAFFTLGQMAFVWAIAVLGVVAVVRDPERFNNFVPALPHGWSQLLVTMGFIYVAFEGFEVIAQAGDETIDPKRNIPKAMLYSVLVVTLTYVVVCFATVVAVRADDPDVLRWAAGEGVTPEAWRWLGSFGNTGFGQAVGKLMPSRTVGALVCFLAVLFSSTSALNATIYSATRASYALGRDHMLPPIFAVISRKRKTPWFALLVTGGIVLTVATLMPTTDVASSASIMFLALFFMVNLCVIKIRRNMGDELDYGFLMPLFPLFPVLAVICQAVLAVWLVHMSLVAWIVAPVWIALGLLFYRFYSRSHALDADHDIRVFEEERAPVVDPGAYRIMVAIANPDNALSMVRTTYAVCGAKDASVELLHMVPVPSQVLLSDAESYMMEGKEAIAETMLYLAPMFPLSTTIRYCRDVARGIVSAVREKKIDMLIMGWHGRSRSLRFKLGSTVDPVVERVPCNVVILKNVGGQKSKKVLVPLAGGFNSALALEVACILADKDDGEVTAFTVQRAGGGHAFDLNEYVGGQVERLELPRERIRTKIASGTDIAGSILREADSPDEDYDLVVLGGTREPLMYQLARDSVPEMVARRCKRPLAMVHAAGGIRSWIKRWL